ncbi:hypothetical protein QZH41_012979, partial [Actinostola sp. cb2023]
MRYYSEINTSLHHSYASLDKKINILGSTFPLHGRVKIGAFGIKSSSPPSLQITVDEEPVSLFNSSGKSPTSHKISVTSSAPKYQPSSSHHRSDLSPWRP